MAGAVTITENVSGSVKMIKGTWATASSSSGDATGVTTKPYNGKILGLATIPGTGGLAPSASYDITIVNNSSVDVLFSGGLNRAAAAIQYVKEASLGAVTQAEVPLTFTVASAGSSHAGTIILYVR